MNVIAELRVTSFISVQHSDWTPAGSLSTSRPTARLCLLVTDRTTKQSIAALTTILLVAYLSMNE